MDKEIDFREFDLIETFAGCFHRVEIVNRQKKELVVNNWKTGEVKTINFKDVMNCWQEKH